MFYNLLELEVSGRIKKFRQEIENYRERSRKQRKQIEDEIDTYLEAEKEKLLVSLTNGKAIANDVKDTVYQELKKHIENMPKKVKSTVVPECLDKVDSDVKRQLTNAEEKTDSDERYIAVLKNNHENCLKDQKCDMAAQSTLLKKSKKDLQVNLFRWQNWTQKDMEHDGEKYKECQNKIKKNPINVYMFMTMVEDWRMKLDWKAISTDL